jgi:hypothetical protein
MKEQLTDKQFERLAKLVGGALAKRWMEIMAKRRDRTKSPQPHPHANHNESRKS